VAWTNSIAASRPIRIGTPETPDANFIDALRALEHRFHRNPAFVDHAAHLLLLARPKRN
jgi:hypothetical protein